MGAHAEAILAKSLRALTSFDPALCAEVMRDDLEIDRLDVAIDAAVLELLATKAPVASDLRLVLATKAMATDLERVGDLARNIAQSVVLIESEGPVELPEKLLSLGEDCRQLLSRALECYAASDAEGSRGVIRADEGVDASESRVIREVLTDITAHPERSAQSVELIMVAKNLERVADHATNIAEDVVLTVESLNLKHHEKLAGGG